MPQNAVKTKDSIATKMIMVALSIYLIVSAIVTCTHIYIEYSYKRTKITNDLRELEKSFESGLAVSLWGLNQQGMEASIDGVMAAPRISGVQVLNLDGEYIATSGFVTYNGLTGETGRHVNLLGCSENEKKVHSNELHQYELFKHSFQLVYRFGENEETIGDVILYSSSASIFQSLKLQFALLAANVIVTLITFSLALSWAFNKHLRIPLQQLTNATANISINNLSDFKLDTKAMKHNEVKVLETALNSMVSDLYKSVQKTAEAEEMLRESEETLSGIINSGETVIYVKDLEGRYLLINSQFEKLFGIDHLSVKGKLDTDIFPAEPAKLFRKNDLEVVHSGEAIQSEETVPHNDGLHSYLSIKFPLRRIDGTIYAVAGISTDITEHKKIERMMIQSEKMQSVAGLAAGMAHEINNPLGGIMQGYQNILNRLNPDKPKNQEAAEKYNLNLEDMYRYLGDRKIITFLNGGRDCCLRAAQIVKNMLMFSRTSDSQAELTNMSELIEHTITLGSSDYDMKKKYDFKFVDIIREYDEDIPPVRCCKSEIEQVLLNLFKNALQAMEHIETEKYKPQFHIRLKNEQHYIRIEVEDNGPGIPDDVQKRIFEPFFTTKASGIGTGLGLSVSYSIITQNHGGTFEVESELAGSLANGKRHTCGKTTFIIRLPIS